jgi:hypothetical protein
MKFIFWILKNALIVVILLIALPVTRSCTQALKPILGYRQPPPSVNLYLPEGVHDNTGLCKWIASNIVYSNVPKNADTVQRPEVTLALKSGVCYDDALLMQALAEKAGYPALHLVEYDVGSKNVYHMVVSDGRVTYDPTYGAVYASLPSGWRLIRSVDP